MGQIDLTSDATTWRSFCLARLRRLVYLAAEADAADVAEWRRLAHHSTFSVFCDCVAAGAEDEARAILAQEITAPGRPC